nr:tripartite tricarboxylate transporter substrate binding protein [uncultured Cupriavidus sp.]
MNKILQLLFAGLTMLAASCVSAQEWPSKTTTIINPFSAGTTTDTVARVVAEYLHRKSGKSVIVDSKPGAGGMIGTSQIAKAPADGSVIGVSIAGPLVMNTLLYKSMAYDPFKDLVPLTLGVNQPCLLVATKSLGVSTVAGLVTALKKNPGKYNYAYVGSGSLGHLVMAMLAMRSDTQVVPVMYAGAGQAITAIIAGDVQMACLPAQGVIGQVKAGKVVPIAVSTAERAALLPHVPALRETYPDIVGSAWIGFIAPAKTPPALADEISKRIAEALRDPDVVALLRQQMMEPAPIPREDFGKFMKAELTRWKPVIERNHISAE